MDFLDRNTTIKLMKKERRVLLVETGSVLDEGIRELVISTWELEVAISVYVNPPTFYEDVAHFLPDVIVMCDLPPLNWTRIPELMHGIQIQKTLRLIVVRSDENMLEVYDKSCVTTARNEDLMSHIIAAETC